MRRFFGFKSIYLKFVVFFTGILLFSSGMSFAIMFFAAPNILLRYDLEKYIFQKTAALQELDAAGTTDLDSLRKLLNDDRFETTVFESFVEISENEVYRDFVSREEYNRLMSGEIVKGRLQGLFKLPFGGVKINEAVMFIRPHVNDSQMKVYKSIVRNTLLLFVCLGSVLIVVAAGMVVRPIKKLTKATKEVAKGNFDVEIKTKSMDEVGQLTLNFNKMARELKNIEYLRKDFISSVSHEFKTPITSIQGFAKLIRDRSLPREQMADYTSVIISETERLSNLSSNLLRLSSLENQDIYQRDSYFLMDEQIRKAVMLLENKWTEKNVIIVPELEQIKYYGNEELLQQVWINLLNNAIKFSHAGGKIDIRLHRTENSIIAEFVDDGIGIRAEDRAFIFEKFFKGEKSRNTEGNGLGLSIVKKIVEIHDGKIYFTSEYGRGAHFTVELPDKKIIR